MNPNDQGYVVVPGMRRSPGTGTVIVVSILTSMIVSSVTVVGMLRLGGEPVARLSGLTGAKTNVRVPDLTGMKSEAADELLNAKQLRMVLGERKADEAPAGTVIAQRPLPQSRVQSGGQVNIVISSGPIGPVVPDILGLPAEKAKQAIEEAGLTVGSTSESEDGEPGTVTSVAPEAGTSLPPNSTVALTVAQASVKVPKLLGERISRAKEMITTAGLKVGNVREIYDSRHRGYVVLKQEPEANSEAPPGSAVSLVINQGD